MHIIIIARVNFPPVIPFLYIGPSSWLSPLLLCSVDNAFICTAVLLTSFRPSLRAYTSISLAKLLLSASALSGAPSSLMRYLSILRNILCVNTTFFTLFLFSTLPRLSHIYLPFLFCQSFPVFRSGTLFFPFRLFQIFELVVFSQVVGLILNRCLMEYRR